MTSLVAWIGADSRGPASLNIACDSRISWIAGQSVSHHWDHGKKAFAAMTAPLIAGYVGDVLFPALVLPGAIDRIDRQVFRTDGAAVEGVISVIRRAWRDYPKEERRPVTIYIGHRVGDGRPSSFRLTKLSNQDGGVDSWQTRDVPIPATSNCLVVDGSGGGHHQGTQGVAGDQRRRYQPFHLQRIRRRGGRRRGPRIGWIATARQSLSNRARSASRNHPPGPAVLRRHASHRR